VIDEAIRPDYYWHEFYRADEYRVGIWVRVVE
jgi:hypothetical protein